MPAFRELHLHLRYDEKPVIVDRSTKQAGQGLFRTGKPACQTQLDKDCPEASPSNSIKREGAEERLRTIFLCGSEANLVLKSFLVKVSSAKHNKLHYMVILGLSDARSLKQSLHLNKIEAVTH